MIVIGPRRLARALTRRARARLRYLPWVMGMDRLALSAVAALPTRAVVRLPARADPDVTAAPSWATLTVVVSGTTPKATLSCLQSLEGFVAPGDQVLLTGPWQPPPTAWRLPPFTRVDQGTPSEPTAVSFNRAAATALPGHLLFISGDLTLRAFPRHASDTTASGVILRGAHVLSAGIGPGADGSPARNSWGEPAASPAVHFRHEIYAAAPELLLTPTTTFASLGGFATNVGSAFAEEYCGRLRAVGKACVLEPELVAVAGPGTHWQRRVRTHEQVSAGPVTRPSGSLCILHVEDRVPHPYLGRGLPRSHALLTTLCELGHQVTFYPRWHPDESWDEVYADIPREVEVMRGHGVHDLAPFLRHRAGSFDLVVVSRPHNMAAYRLAVVGLPALAAMPVIYDAEALFCLREIERRQRLGPPLPQAEADAMVAAELAQARDARAVLCVSAGEAARFRGAGLQNVEVLRHVVEASPCPEALGERRGLLFVGPVNEPGSPNADAVRWFAQEVLPLIRTRLGDGVQLDVAGQQSQPARAFGDANLLGIVDDLNPLYARARAFVAPMRFAAGIPLKVLESAARGLPVAGTPLVAQQLEWTPGLDLVTGASAEELAHACIGLLQDDALWRRVRAAGLDRVRQECSAREFTRTLDRAIQVAVAGPPSPAPGLALD